jgi:hypothetical protein
VSRGTSNSWPTASLVRLGPTRRVYRISFTVENEPPTLACTTMTAVSPPNSPWRKLVTLAVTKACTPAAVIRIHSRSSSPYATRWPQMERQRSLCRLLPLRRERPAGTGRLSGRRVVGLTLLLVVMARGNNELIGRFVAASLRAFRPVAPGRDGMPAARGLAFAAAVRMIDRVHAYAAIMRHTAEPTVSSRLAYRNIHVIGIRHRADRRKTLAMNQALLA